MSREAEHALSDSGEWRDVDLDPIAT